MTLSGGVYGIRVSKPPANYTNVPDYYLLGSYGYYNGSVQSVIASANISDYILFEKPGGGNWPDVQCYFGATGFYRIV